MNRGKYLLTLFNLIMIALLSYMGVDLFYNVVSAQSTPYIKSPEPISANRKYRFFSNNVKRKSRTPLSHYKTIIERDLFNAKAVSAKPKVILPKNIEHLEKTKLNLKLWGTVSSATNRAYAVIENTDGKRSKRRQLLYRKGDRVQGAVIDRILDEKVVLTLDGKQQVLELEDTVGKNRTRSRYNPVTASHTGGGKPIHMKRRLSRSQIENAMANLNEVMKQIRIFPHQDGIKVSYIKSRSIFGKMGLKNGDIITGVNGQPLTSVEDAMGMYEQLQSSSNISVQIKRRGRDRVIDYSIN